MKSKITEWVLEILEHEAKPMKAYHVLQLLNSHGVTAPTSVYRALDQLEKRQLVHRLPSQHAWIACRQATCKQQPEHAKSMLFLSCLECGSTEERYVHDHSDVPQGFQVESRVTEIIGTCRTCSD